MAFGAAAVRSAGLAAYSRARDGVGVSDRVSYRSWERWTPAGKGLDRVQSPTGAAAECIPGVSIPPLQTRLWVTLLALSLSYDAGAEENPDAFCFKVSEMHKWVLISWWRG